MTSKRRIHEQLLKPLSRGAAILAIVAGSTALADSNDETTARPKTMAIGAFHHPTSPPNARRERSLLAPSSGGWWVSMAVIAVGLAAFGGLSIAAGRWRGRPTTLARNVHVVGRTSLTPRHSIFVVRAGEKTLLLGVGPQGAPTLLGDLSPSGESAVTIAARPGANQ